MTIVGHTSVDTTWTQWLERCSIRLRSPHNTSDPIARHRLGEAPEQLPGLPGTWWVIDGRVFIAAKPGDRLDHAGERIAGIEIIDPIDGAPGLILRQDDRALEVVRRGDLIAVNVYGPAD
ncbi:hypothetical protein [Nocardia sp. NBC_01329]|uniref:hypothetical protein n=1 Tax=Nocardia sp. NBC_01329 TaxID=2903594 RepID=UPI002E123855|nr:hypothetical protein OG405_17760 [Nocardia sp. NBC_01329]